MKYVFIFLITTIFSVTSLFAGYKESVYTKLWNTADKYSQKGDVKSALNTVKTIFTYAKKNNDIDQYIHSLLTILAYNKNVEKDYLVKNHIFLQKELANAQAPYKQILHSLMGDIYCDMFLLNRWDINKKKEIVNIKDINSWNIATFVDFIGEQYTLSLNEPEMLKTIQTDSLKNIIVRRNDNVDERTITLYNFLADRAIDIFIQKKIKNCDTPSRAIFNMSELFSDNATFVSIDLKTIKDDSFYWHALRLLQTITKNTQTENDIGKSAEIELKRIKIVYQEAIGTKKDTLYRKALLRMLEVYRATPVVTEIAYELSLFALHQIEHPFYYNDEKMTRQEILEICMSAFAAYPDSYGAKLCDSIIKKIFAKELDCLVENYLEPEKPLQAHLIYRNINRVYCKIQSIEKNEYNSYVDLGTVIAVWDIHLTDEKDYNTHSVRIALPSLRSGMYLMTISNNSNFDLHEGVVISTKLVVTDIFYTFNQAFHFNFIRRSNGEPLKNIYVATYNKIKVINKNYSKKYEEKDYKYMLYSEYLPDKSGNIRISWDGLDNGKYLYARHGGDWVREMFFYLGEEPKDYYFTSKKDEYTVSLYTDRNIYRPGQTLFYRGLLTKTDEKNNSIVVNHPVKMKFDDFLLNEHVTNEFGTFSGSFTIPDNYKKSSLLLNCQHGGKYVSVEQYKRPTFEIKLDTPHEQYKLGTPVRLKGCIVSYAGFALRHVQVHYTITGLYGHSRYEKSILVSNSLVTDEFGNFEIEFNTTNDVDFINKNHLSFSYKIEVVATDLSGETQSASSIIQVQRQAIELDIIMDNIIENSKKAYSIAVNALNQSKNTIALKGTMIVYKLTKPSRLLRESYLPIPDRFVMTEDEYSSKFPYDAYKAEDFHWRWPKEKIITTRQFGTGISNSIVIEKFHTWEEGEYVFEFYVKDEFGTDIVVKKYVKIVRNRKKYRGSLFFVYPREFTASPGKTMELYVSSAVENNVLVEIEKRGKIVDSYWLRLNNSIKKVKIPVSDNDYGGFFIHLSCIVLNRYFTETVKVNVPYNHKKLSITVDSLRYKLYPGNTEHWRFTVYDYRLKPINAEMGMVLYDASLDKYKSNNWALSLYPAYISTYKRYSRYYNRGNNSFTHIKRAQGSYFDNYDKYSVKLTPSPYHLNTYEYEWEDPYAFKPILLAKRYDSLFIEGEIKKQFPAIVLNSKDAISTYIRSFFPRHVIESNSMNPVANEAFLSAMNTYIVKNRLFYKREVFQEYETSFDEEIRSLISNNIAEITDMELYRLNRLLLELFYPDYIAKSYELYEEIPDSQGFIPYPQLVPGFVADSSNMYLPKEDIQSTLYIRRNFNETAFFYPHLRSNKKGQITFDFVVPDSLTKWRLLGLAHTKDLEYGFIQKEFITQKDLMVIPNSPRFLREGDTIDFTAKIINLTENIVKGRVELLLFDTEKMEPIHEKFLLLNAQQSFIAQKGSSDLITWKLTIPYGISAVTYRIVAKSDNFSDGEERVLPILTNRMLVTESMPLPVRSLQTKEFTFKKLVENKSTTLCHHKLTIEFTSNPAWYAVQALPYLIEYPYECTEQTFSRFYANSIASYIANSSPRIKKVFDAWKTEGGKDALLSNLEKNQELKSLFMEETPWIYNAKNETERKHRIGVLFDLNRLADERDKVFAKIEKAQNTDGSFSWFPGGRPARFITQHIISGFGHLGALHVYDLRKDYSTWNMITKAVRYLDNRMYDDFIALEKNVSYDEYLAIHYLYMRSFFLDIPLSAAHKKAYDYYIKIIKKEWYKKDLYSKAMIALALHRAGDKETPKMIIESLKEYALHSEEMGMYWKFDRGYYWYQAPIETQAMLIEAFAEITNDPQAVDDMKTWLIKQKQTQDWGTTKATVEACYALLLRGADWLAETKLPTIVMGGKELDITSRDDVQVQEGTGYFKTSWSGSEVISDMGKVTVTNNNNVVAWGALYWQYFEQLDKITPHETPLKLTKKLFVERQSDKGPVIEPITEQTVLKPGDRVKVRIELRVDRAMEYVHMKDMRASGFEPENVFSQYKWQDGLGYYEATKDAATNFFIDWLPKGTYVFEYPLRVTHTGNFSNGITTIQCMYAPEFTSHSEGIRVNITGK